MRSPLAVAALLLVLVAACTSGGADPSGGPTGGPTGGLAAPSAAASTPTDPAPTPSDVASAPASPVASSSEPSGSQGGDRPSAADVAAADAQADPGSVALGLEQVAVLEQPLATAVHPTTGQLHVAERAGTVRVVAADGGVGDPVVDIRDRTATSGERGLLGIAFSPEGDQLVLSSSDVDGATRLESAPVVDGRVDAAGIAEVLRVPQPASNHNGGDVAFGPDGMLYLGLGDGGGSDDRFDQGQRPDTLLGALLRLDLQDDGYAIPPDNPFADGGGGAPEVWAYGLRNPWRFAFDPPTGTLWIGDVGQGAVEEVDRVAADAAGLNYGWPAFEGDQRFRDDVQVEGPVVEPVHTYGHDEGCSITGGRVYRGRAIPALRGAYLYADLCSGVVTALALDADGAVRDVVDTGLRVDGPVSFGVDPDGELLVLSLAGPVSRIVQEQP